MNSNISPDSSQVSSGRNWRYSPDFRPDRHLPPVWMNDGLVRWLNDYVEKYGARIEPHQPITIDGNVMAVALPGLKAM